MLGFKKILQIDCIITIIVANNTKFVFILLDFVIWY